MFSLCPAQRIPPDRGRFEQININLDCVKAAGRDQS